MTMRSVARWTAAAALLVAPAAVQAQTVSFAWHTNGCFNACVLPTTSAFQTATLLGLTYQNAQGSGTTSAGFLGVGAASGTIGTQEVDNFGAFYLTGAAHSYTGNTFTLSVTFSIPTGIIGSPTATYTALITGNVTSTSVGGVDIDFDNTLQNFTFANASQTGSFSLRVNDVSMLAGQAVPVTGVILARSVSSVPEPITMTLLGTGLLGIAGAARRRRKNNGDVVDA